MNKTKIQNPTTKLKISSIQLKKKAWKGEKYDP